MALRARVGRHTQAGGRHCQNWSDDQQAVVSLLNSISVPDGGTGGSLTPRIVAHRGDALYNAIVAFENKYFPGQRRGFVDPGGNIHVKLEALARAAAAPPARPAAPPPPPPPPAPLPSKRRITSGEETLLRSVFLGTLPYTTAEVAANLANLGGEDNNITPGNTPFFATSIWCADFSDLPSATATGAPSSTNSRMSGNIFMASRSFRQSGWRCAISATTRTPIRMICRIGRPHRLQYRTAGFDHRGLVAHHQAHAAAQQPRRGQDPGGLHPFRGSVAQRGSAARAANTNNAVPALSPRKARYRPVDRSH